MADPAVTGPTPREPIRLVQVGAGAMGRVWLKVIGDSPDAELVGLIDIDTDVARRAAAEAGFADVPVAYSLDQLLANVDADAVVNVTIPASHPGVSMTALLAGLPVLCEKPLAETVGEALSMVAAAEVSGRLLMVSQSRRYWRQLAAYRRQISQLGAVNVVNCSFFKAPHFGGFREEMAFPLLLDMAIHQFDLARDLIGAEPIAVYCESFNPTGSWYRGDAAALAVFEFEGGARFAFNGSWCSPGLETSWNGSWRVTCLGGSAVWDGDHGPVAADANGRSVIADPDDEPEQIAGSLAEFVAALRANTVPPSEAHSNVLSLAMVEAAIASARSGRRVLIADILTDGHLEALNTEERPEIRDALEAWSSVHDIVGLTSRTRAAQPETS